MSSGKYFISFQPMTDLTNTLCTMDTVEVCYPNVQSKYWLSFTQMIFLIAKFKITYQLQIAKA